MPMGSFECKKFADEIDMKIITSSPNYPKSNGLAERAVQLCKKILKKSEKEEEVLKSLLAYRMTPVKGLNYTPAQLTQSRNLRIDLPMQDNKLQPQLCKNVDIQQMNKQSVMKTYYDRDARQRAPFVMNQKVLFQNNNKWQLGIITEICETPRSYIIRSNGREYRRNSNHIRSYFDNNENQSKNSANSNRLNSSQVPKFTRSGRTY